MTGRSLSSRPGRGVLQHPAPVDEASESLSPSTLRVAVVWGMVTVSLLSWRNDVYYSGGLDPVVLAKSLLSVVAFVLAYALWQGGDRTLRVGVRTCVIVFVYLSATVLGGWASGVLLGSIVTAIRVAIVAATVVLLVMSVPANKLVRSLAYAMTVVALATCFPGLPSALAGVRLAGHLLPLNPNQLAMMFGFHLILVTWQSMTSSPTPRWIAGFLALTGLIWLTGSRTGLAAALLGVAVVIMLSQRVPVASFIGVVLAIPAAFYVALGTGVLAKFVGRGAASTNVTTFNSRTIAWKAAFSAHQDIWGELFGRGLTAKTVAVSGTYWNTQVLDSSWVSAFVQGGWVGLVLLGFWALLALWGVAHIPQPARPFWVALWLYCILWSITASGLLDAYVLFILMVTVSLAGERPMRSWASMAG
jgi:hypothetical protein